MKRLMEKTVFVGLVTACRLATVPTSRSPLWVKATTDGVVRPPSAFSMTVGSPPSRTAMHEFVVPRSIPMVLPMWGKLLLCVGFGGGDAASPHKISVRSTQILAGGAASVQEAARSQGPRCRQGSRAGPFVTFRPVSEPESGPKVTRDPTDPAPHPA